MIFVLHGKKEKGIFDNFQGMIKSLVSDGEIEVLRSKECLTGQLLNVSCGRPIVVLITADRQELNYLLSKIALLRRARVIVIISDREPETIRIGYKLEPRYLSSETQDFSEIKAVLRNMLSG